MDTVEASDICGTHFGETKEVTSIEERPVRESLLMSSIFVGVGTNIFSF